MFAISLNDELSVDTIWRVASWTLKLIIIGTTLSSAVLVALASAARLLQWRTLKHLRHLPGRYEIIPFLNHWIQNKACSQAGAPVGRATLFLNAVLGHHARFKKHGLHVLYVGFYPLLVLYRADLVEKVLNSNKNLTKSRQYGFLHTWLGTGLLTSTGNKWKTRRRMFTPAFHFRILEDFTPTINAQSMLLADIIEKESVKSEILDVVPKVTLCTLDIVCETIMGTPLNAQSNSQSSYVRAVNRLAELFLQRIIKPLHWNDFIYRSSKNGKENNACLNVVHAFTKKVISERKEKLKMMVDDGALKLNSDISEDGVKSKFVRPLLDLLLLEHFKDAENINEEDIREEVDTFMFEGHDTTAMGISWALFLIGHSPMEQQKIHDELDAIFGEDTERHVDHNDLKEMKYLECAIKESQRIYPSVPFISRKCEEPFELDGVTIPQGTTIQIANFLLHRDESVFPKPEEFHPERFLPENAKGRHPFAFAPFSAGPRNCIGQRFAMSEEKIVIANILRRFKIKSIDQRDQVEIVSEMVLRPKSGLRMKFTPRK